eukprot:TRINITY_DN62711_c0_g1_i1.p1 TRINITY_DN62711_c0_g1~~TRINITY_DN62711_c0_g1_i1.p1  ORF type:complete len:181 (-),score=45.25 TRINITY_DN62711_c0_g1_i1:9-551(-)
MMWIFAGLLLTTLAPLADALFDPSESSATGLHSQYTCPSDAPAQGEQCMLMAMLRETVTKEDVRELAGKYGSVSALKAMYEFKMVPVLYGSNITACCAAYHEVSREKVVETVELGTPPALAGGSSLADADYLLLDGWQMRSMIRSMASQRGEPMEIPMDLPESASLEAAGEQADDFEAYL